MNGMSVCTIGTNKSVRDPGFNKWVTNQVLDDQEAGKDSDSI